MTDKRLSCGFITSLRVARAVCVEQRDNTIWLIGVIIQYREHAVMAQTILHMYSRTSLCLIPEAYTVEPHYISYITYFDINSSLYLNVLYRRTSLYLIVLENRTSNTQQI